MKIACICNMNNMMFILCRYLRDAGYDAQLFTLSDEPAHFHPSADSYDDEYLTYYHPFPFSKSTIYKADSINQLREKLGDFDFFIGSDIAPAILSIIGLKLDVFIPHGSDIYDFPFRKKRSKNTDPVWWQREIGTLSQLQKVGIEEITTILFPDEYDIHFPFKNKLDTKANYINTSGPMVYIHQYQKLAEQKKTIRLEHAAKFDQIRASKSLILFSHSRHNGFDLSGAQAIHDKGNDHLIKGFAAYLSNHDSSAHLILFEYGINVSASRSLIASLGITEHVSWMPLMDRKEIMYGLSQTDIACGQFKNSWLTCGVVNESLALDKPLLHLRDDRLYQADYSTLYPILNAHTPAEIAEKIHAYQTNRDAFDEEAQSSSEWLYNHTVAIPLQIIQKAVKKKRPSSRLLPDHVQMKVEHLLKKHAVLDKKNRLRGKVRSIFQR